MKIQKYGWTPDTPDQRDLVYKPKKKTAAKLPTMVDLRSACPPVYDQGQLGSCTANAIGAAFQFEAMKQDASKAFMPSRLFIYYNERSMEGTVNSDAGAVIRDGIKSVNKLGVCPETMWPYDISKFKDQAPAPAYQDALNNQVTSYQRVTRDLAHMQACLADGYPFVFGITVYESFESDAVAKTGVLNMPKKGEKTVGGHAILCVGYNAKSKRFIIRNSWGSGWGQAGYFTIPFAYLLSANLSDDFWTIRTVE